MTEATLVAMQPAEEAGTMSDEAELVVEQAEAVVEEAEGQREVTESRPQEAENAGGALAVPNRLALILVFLRPASVFRSVGPTAWRTALAVVGAAALLRMVAFVSFEASGGSSTPRMIVSAIAGLLSPFVFVAVAALALITTAAVVRLPRQPLTALSLASLTAMPIALKALLQTATMVATQHALHPSGIVGLIAPDAPPLLLFLLAPIDLFGIWAVSLFAVAIYVSLGRDEATAEDAAAEDATTVTDTTALTLDAEAALD